MLSPSRELALGHRADCTLQTAPDHPLACCCLHQLADAGHRPTLDLPGAPFESIHARRDVGTVNIEGELAVVIGRDTDGLTLDTAFDYVFG